MRDCLKQTTRCVIVRVDGRHYEATNQCNVDGLEICPREAAGCERGSGYELCGCIHAEVTAANMAAESKDIPGQAFVSGNNWICRNCQDALRAVNVHAFQIVSP